MKVKLLNGGGFYLTKTMSFPVVIEGDFDVHHGAGLVLIPVSALVANGADAEVAAFSEAEAARPFRIGYEVEILP